jgi:5S rRNA maturation endonuclease (ribonuclease M5)/KaiC/GvpD/RAD55 family RecA-like ATPase
MTQAIPAGLEKSAAMRYVISKGWSWKEASGGQIQIEECPFCHHKDYKFYCAVSDPEESTRDGLFFCHAGSCQKTGNLRTLQEALGDRIPGVESKSEWAGKSGKVDELPNVDVCHALLLGDSEAMDYLKNVRHFSEEVIRQQKLGLKEKVYFHGVGEAKALVIPYMNADGAVTFAKYRTLPPNDKAFASPQGWEVGLYNSGVLTDDCAEVIMVEGEADCISLLSNGVLNVVGVPGAGVRKATWIETLDRIAPKIYILYDSDSAGTKGSQELASRIGIDKCLKITLPKEVKDIGEFFCKGGTVEGIEELKAAARLFDITGVTSSKDALQQLEDELNGKVDLAPTYISPWPELNKLVGFEAGDVIDIVAPEKVGKTTLGLNLLDHMVKTYGEDGLFVCLEMTQNRLARKWISHVTGFEDTITVPGTQEAKSKLVELKAAIVKAREIQQSRSADLYFAYPALVKEPEDVFKLIRDCIRRYGVQWVVFDNVQRLADDTLKNQGHRTVHLSQISKQFAKIAKDYRIKLIRILQPKRIEKGQLITTNDVDGSSQVAKDCDSMICMWRSVVGEMKKSEYDEQSIGFTETSQSFDPKTRLTVGLSRYSSGGSCYVLCDGARSTFRSYREDEKAKMNTNLQKFNNVIPMESGASVPVVPIAEVKI